MWYFWNNWTTEKFQKFLKSFAKNAEQRGKDSSGLCFLANGKVNTFRADFSISKLLKNTAISNSNFVLGHSRLITNGLGDNQPVIGEHCIVFHNGIVVNEDKVWPNLEAKKSLEIDTEVIAAIADQIVSRNDNLTTITTELTQRCEGVISCAIAIPKLGKLVLYSNNGSLYSGKIDETIFSQNVLF